MPSLALQLHQQNVYFRDGGAYFEVGGLKTSAGGARW